MFKFHLPPQLTTVTKETKILAMIIFVGAPFLAFLLGMKLQNIYDSQISAQREMALAQKYISNSVIPTPTLKPTSKPLQNLPAELELPNKPYKLTQFEQDPELQEKNTNKFYGNSDAIKMRCSEKFSYFIYGNKGPLTTTIENETSKTTQYTTEDINILKIAEYVEVSLSKNLHTSQIINCEIDNGYKIEMYWASSGKDSFSQPYIVVFDTNTDDYNSKFNQKLLHTKYGYEGCYIYKVTNNLDMFYKCRGGDGGTGGYGFYTFNLKNGDNKSIYEFNSSALNE
jgi:hypothetical protein